MVVYYPNKDAPEGGGELSDSQILFGDIGREPTYPPTGTCPIGEEIVISRSITITKEKNKVVLSGRWFFSSNTTNRKQTFRVRLNNLAGAIIQTQDIATGEVTPSQTNAEEVTINEIITDIPIGTTALVLTREHTGTFSCSAPRQSPFVFDVFIIESG